MLWLVVLLGASAVYLVRQVLIVSGLLKGPLLRRFEQYGDDEPVYYPLPGILISLGAFLLAFGFLVYSIIPAPFLPGGPAVLAFAAAYAAWHYRDAAYRHPEISQAYPRWLAHLREYTTREERRRIAYRWLTLSWRTRLFYNSSDKAFLLWADLVVLATVA
jgi:hypothetical protein